MRKLLMIAVVAISMTSCMTLTHTVNNGGTVDENPEVKESRWYAVWGLVPIGKAKNKDIKKLTDKENYTVETKITAIDGIISFFTGIATIQRQTVEVYE